MGLVKVRSVKYEDDSEGPSRSCQGIRTLFWKGSMLRSDTIRAESMRRLDGMVKVGSEIC